MVGINCDLCGKVEENFFRTIIEGVELSVCPECSKFGKVIAPCNDGARNPARKPHPREQKTEILVENYQELIKKARESKDMSQKDFALKLNERESTVHKIETGTFQPELSLIKKLEGALGLKLLEEYGETALGQRKKKDDGLTLGDFIILKPKK